MFKKFEGILIPPSYTEAKNYNKDQILHTQDIKGNKIRTQPNKSTMTLSLHISAKSMLPTAKMTVVKIQTLKKKPRSKFFSFSIYLPKPTWFQSHAKNIALTRTTSKTEENEQTIPVSRIKARYEFFLFLKASRLRYPARRSSNPMPTPPANEAVLPFFIYP
jgi:hypothetical protein